MKSRIFTFLFKPLEWVLRPVAGAFVLCAAFSGAAQTNFATIPIEFKHGHIMVPARVKGSNTVWLMLDTGFSITMIEPRVADLLNLPPKGRTTIAGIAGE